MYLASSVGLKNYRFNGQIYYLFYIYLYNNLKLFRNDCYINTVYIRNLLISKNVPATTIAT